MLKCNSCKWIKNDSDFYTSNQTTCKECVKKRAREHRASNIDYYREYDKARANNANRIEARNAYAKTEQGKNAHNRAKKAWTSANTVKRKAVNAVNNAIRSGKLIKSKNCESCQKSNCRIEGHHSDYGKPLEVDWLCSSCHRAWHKENGEALNG